MTIEEASVDQKFTGFSATMFALEIITFLTCMGCFIIYEIIRYSLCALNIYTKQTTIEYVVEKYKQMKKGTELVSELTEDVAGISTSTKVSPDTGSDDDVVEDSDEKEENESDDDDEEEEEEDAVEEEGGEVVEVDGFEANVPMEDSEEQSEEENAANDNVDGYSTTDDENERADDDDENPYVEDPAKFDPPPEEINFVVVDDEENENQEEKEEGKDSDDKEDSDEKEKGSDDEEDEHYDDDDDNAKEEDKDSEDSDGHEKEKKEFVISEGYGMTSIIFLDHYPNLSTTVCLIARIIFLIHNLVFLIYGMVVYEQDEEVWILYYRWLTHCSFLMLTIYYVISVLYTGGLLGLLCVAKGKYNPKKPHVIVLFFEYIVRMFFLNVFISAVMITLAFWILDVPVAAALGKFRIFVTTFPMHGVNALFVIIELLALYKVKFPPCLCWFSGAYPWIYIIWVTILVKSKGIEEYPYNGLMSNDANAYSTVVRIIIGAAFAGLHLVMSLCCYGKQAGYLVIKKLWEIQKEKKRGDIIEGDVEDDEEELRDGDAVEMEEFEVDETDEKTDKDEEEEGGGNAFTGRNFETYKRWKKTFGEK